MIDHAGLRGGYLRFVDMAHLAQARDHDHEVPTFATWLVRQPVGWLNAYGVESVGDVKEAVASWGLWSARVR